MEDSFGRLQRRLQYGDINLKHPSSLVASMPPGVFVGIFPRNSVRVEEAGITGSLFSLRKGHSLLKIESCGNAAGSGQTDRVARQAAHEPYKQRRGV